MTSVTGAESLNRAQWLRSHPLVFSSERSHEFTAENLCLTMCYAVFKMAINGFSEVSGLKSVEHD